MKRFLVLVLATAAVATAVSSSTGTAAGSKGWQTLMSVKAQGIFPLGWASGRVWFVVDGAQDDKTVWSARVGAGGLTSLVSTGMGQSDIQDAVFVGSNLLSGIAPPGQPGTSSIAPLLPSGKVGAFAPLPGNPEATVGAAGITPANQGAAQWRASAGVQVGGRTVWALGGHTCPSSGSHKCGINGGGYSWFAVCCSATGQPVDLTSLLTSQTKAGATSTRLGVDSRGRLWLGWLDGASSRPGVALKLVQLDPATLKPLHAQKLDHALLFGYAGTSSVAFACTSSCCFVYEALSGVFSWDGAGPPARLWVRNIRKDIGGHLLGASGRAGGIDLASYADKVPNVPDSGQRLTLDRGDARGKSPRPRTSIDVPMSLPRGATHIYSLQSLPSVIFTPSGLVALAFYASDDGSPSKLLAAVLRG